MAAARWKWTSYAGRPAWSLSWMARNISQMRKPIGETGGRTPCCSRMDILCCDSWRKIRASASIRFWMPFWPLSLIVRTVRELGKWPRHIPPSFYAVRQRPYKLPQKHSSPAMTNGWHLFPGIVKVGIALLASKIQSVAKPVHQIHILMQHRKDQRALLFPDEVEHVVMCNS